MKLYKYQSDDSLLCKELLHNEIYLASADELYDPLDLAGRLNFFTMDSSHVSALSEFVIRNAFVILGIEKRSSIHFASS